MTFIGYIITAWLGCLSLAVAYLYFLAAVGLIFRRRPAEAVPDRRFLLLVPAYNEENTIGRTLESLARLQGASRLTVVVIADNCTDATAEIARSSGVEVLMRTDPDHRGKGYALEYALARYDLDRFDAVVVVDADTEVQPDLLLAVAASLEQGYGAVQVHCGLRAAQPAPLAHLQNIANAAENVLFYKPRGLLHLPVLLRGTGMAISTGVLKKFPWDSHSITEDADYALTLLKNGVSIDFSTAGKVWALATSSYDQAYSQRLRWSAGIFGLIFSKALPLAVRGIATGRLLLVELAVSMLLLSRTTLILAAGLAVVAALLAGRLDLAVWAVVLAVALVCYLLLGILLVEDKKSALKATLHLPIYGVWQALLVVRSLFGHRKVNWVRTERK